MVALVTVKHLTYLDLTPEQRMQAANEARAKIRVLLANPFITEDQAFHLSQQLARLNHWERGTLPVQNPPEIPENPSEPVSRRPPNRP